MSHLLNEKKRLIFLLLGLLLLSCGGKVTTRTPSTEYKFTINGVVVKDLNLNKDVASFTIWRDSDPFDGALVQVGFDTVKNQGNGNYYKEGSELFDFGQNISIIISSAQDDFSLATSIVIPGFFSIVELPANDTLNTGGHSVAVTWNPSDKASGYFLSVINPDVALGLVGYTVRDENKDRAENIPPDAFRTKQDSLVQGIYEVYVIAYYKTFLEYLEMPFDLPEGLPTNNIEGADGTIGAGVVAQKKYIRVVAE